MANLNTLLLPVSIWRRESVYGLAMLAPSINMAKDKRWHNFRAKVAPKRKVSAPAKQMWLECTMNSTWCRLLHSHWSARRHILNWCRRLICNRCTTEAEDESKRETLKCAHCPILQMIEAAFPLSRSPALSLSHSLRQAAHWPIAELTKCVIILKLRHLFYFGFITVVIVALHNHGNSRCCCLL